MTNPNDAITRLNHALAGYEERFAAGEVTAHEHELVGAWQDLLGSGYILAPSETPTNDHQMFSVRRVALVAHDKMKPQLLEWAEYNKRVLSQASLIATGTTGALLMNKLDTHVDRLLSGPLGGDQQIGALIAQGEIDILVFFWDPLEPQPHDPDVRALLRLCQVWNIPVATNRATADYLISSPLFRSDYTHITPDYETHNNRMSVKP